MTLWPKPLAERSSSASGQWTCHLDAESSKAQDHSLHWRQDPSQPSQRCGGKPLQRDSPNNPRQAINFQVISRYGEVKSSSLTPRLPPYHVAAPPVPGVHSQARDSAELPFVFAKLALAPEFTGKQPLGSFLAKFFFLDTKNQTWYGMVRSAPRAQPVRIRITNLLAEYWDEANLGLLAIEGMTEGGKYLELGHVDVDPTPLTSLFLRKFQSSKDIGFQFLNVFDVMN